MSSPSLFVQQNCFMNRYCGNSRNQNVLPNQTLPVQRAGSPADSRLPYAESNIAAETYVQRSQLKRNPTYVSVTKES